MRLCQIDGSGNFREFVCRPFAKDYEESVLEEWLAGNADGILEDESVLLIGRQVATNLGSFWGQGRISPAQIKFIGQYLKTGNKKAAAEAAGCSRSTVYEWFKKDFEFQAAFNRALKSLEEEQRTDLLLIRGAALKSALRAVEGDDVRATLQVLGLVLRLDPRVAGSEDPDELRKDAIVEEIDRQDRLRRRYSRAGDELQYVIDTLGVEAAGEEVLELLHEGGLLSWSEKKDDDEE